MPFIICCHCSAGRVLFPTFNRKFIVERRKRLCSRLYQIRTGNGILDSWLKE